jgi:hypothetical protein
MFYRLAEYRHDHHAPDPRDGAAGGYTGDQRDSGRDTAHPPRFRRGGDDEMLMLSVGDEVKVRMPEGRNNRGVMGVHLMYTTMPEAKFDGAVGVITQIDDRSSLAIDPRGDLGRPQFLVDFRGHKNPRIPWQAQWFRENWLESTAKPGVGDEPEDAAVTPPDRTGGPVHQ